MCSIGSTNGAAKAIDRLCVSIPFLACTAHSNNSFCVIPQKLAERHTKNCVHLPKNGMQRHTQNIDHQPLCLRCCLGLSCTLQISHVPGQTFWDGCVAGWWPIAPKIAEKPRSTTQHRTQNICTASSHQCLLLFSRGGESERNIWGNCDKVLGCFPDQCLPTTSTTGYDPLDATIVCSKSHMVAEAT